MYKLKIAFVYPKRYSFYPPDYVSRGLGGTESTLVLLARAIARLGHAVEVYNCCFKPGVYDGVVWSSLLDIDSKREYDVVISLRLLETFRDYHFNAKLRALWIHDEALSGAEDFDKNGIVNTWISVSETQKKSLCRDQYIEDTHWFVTRNAYDEDIYTDELRKTKKIKNRAIYCSAPDRGLKYLLEMWPAIKAEVPDASLVVTGSYALWGTSDEENKRIFADIYSMADKTDDVQILQRVSKQELSKLQVESEVMLYPTDFNEMFCISALECFAAGTPIISSKRAAMIERVEEGKTGFLIDGDPKNLDCKERFIATAVRFLNDEKMKHEFSKNTLRSSAKLNFDNLAREWEIELMKRLEI